MLPASSWFRPNPDPLLYMLLELLHIHAENYRQTSNISRTSVGNKIVHHSDVVGESPIGAAPTTSSFSTSRQTTSEQTIQFWDLVWLILDVWWYWAAFMTSEIKKNVFAFFIMPQHWVGADIWNPADTTHSTSWLLMTWRRKEPGIPRLQQ